jgi:hypothetical protein
LEKRTHSLTHVGVVIDDVLAEEWARDLIMHSKVEQIALISSLETALKQWENFQG